MLAGFTMRSLRSLKTGRPQPSLEADRPTSVDEAEAAADESEDECLPGHAVDVLQLLQQRWFGVGPRGKANPRSGRPKTSSSPTSGSPQLKPAPEPGSQQQLSTEARLSPFHQESSVSAAVSAATARRPERSAPVPTSVPKPPPLLPEAPPPEALAVQQLPGIGTWAGRQRLFARPADLRGLPSSSSPDAAEPMEPPGTPCDADAAVAADLKSNSGATGRPPRTPETDGLLSSRSSVRSEQAREEAWRWRFSRKWEAEQKKYYEEASTASVISNDALDAIQYTQACGMGENLQFASSTIAPLGRTISRTSDQGGYLQHSLSCQFDVSGHGGSQALGALSAAAGSGGSLDLQQQQQQQHSQLDSGSQYPQPRRGQAPWLRGSPSDAGGPSATNQVLSMMTKARDLLQKQQQIEQEAQSRWERSMAGGSDEAWVGQHLRPVQISMSGRFRYVVLRAVDSKGRQRYLVRGRSKALPAELLEETVQEAASVCKRKGLPAVSIEAVGGGVMEWREDTDRHLHLSAAPSSGDGLSTNGGLSPTKRGSMLGDVTALAASLVRQVLPCHFQISTTSIPNRMASLMDTLHI